MAKITTAKKLSLQGELTIYTAAAVKKQLVPPLTQGRDLTIDLASVTEIDTAGLQLLILAKKETIANGVKLQLRNVSAPVTELLALAGLNAYFAG